jgi:antitoxin (DNA-binding transcriptional repressor) of toxin-antitoxin stability system
MWTYFVHMRKATLRDLRNDFAKLEAWLGEGEEICIEKRGRPIAMLTPMKTQKRVQMPDFEARRKAIWGDRIFTEEEVRAMREAELEGEEG